jgi:membrane associated rhomboid family serine protease
MKRTSCPFHTREIHRSLDGRTFLSEVFRRVRFLDLALIFAPLIPLFGIQFQPDPVRQAFVLDYAEPSVVTLYTTHFVHVNWTHFFGNVGGYVLIASIAYLLSVLSNRRRHFLAVFALTLTVVPVALSGLALLSRNSGVGMGFSGILMALFGYFSLVLVAFLAVRFSETLHLDHAFVLFSLGLVITILRTKPSVDPGSFSRSGLVLLLFVLSFSLIRSLSNASLRHIVTGLQKTGYIELALTGIVLFVFTFATAFEGGSVADGSDIATDLHAFGFVLGFGLSYAALRTDCSIAHIRHCARPGSECELHDSLLTRLLRGLLPPPRRAIDR